MLISKVLACVAILGVVSLTSLSSSAVALPDAQDSGRAQIQTNLLAIQNQLPHLGVELLIAGPLDSRIESTFGHAALRFVNLNSEDRLSDVVISIWADVPPDDSPQFFEQMRNGATGAYKLIPQLMTMGELISTYQRYENRPLLRYIVPTTLEQRSAVLNQLIKINHSPDKLGRYVFQKRNCLTVALEILNNAGLKQFRDSPIIPVQGGAFLQRNLISPFPALKIDSLDQVVKEIKQHHPYLPENPAHWPAAVSATFPKMNFASIYILLYSPIQLPTDLARALKKTVLARRAEMNLDEIYKLSISTTPEIYQISTTGQNCIEISDEFYAHWTPMELARVARRQQSFLQEIKSAQNIQANKVWGDYLAQPFVQNTNCLSRQVLEKLEINL